MASIDEYLSQLPEEIRRALNAEIKEADDIEIAKLTQIIIQTFIAKAVLTSKGDLLSRSTTDIEALPAGVDGKFLQRDDAESTGLKWADPSGTSSPLTTKGDLYGYDTDNARIPVGPDGQFLKSNSVESVGVEWVDIIPAGRDFTTQTSTELHVYADGTSGSDLNDGLTALTPKKTLAAVLGLIPEVIKHNTAVHLSGVFEDAGLVYLSRQMISLTPGFAPKVVIAGESAVVSIAGPFTATASDPSKLYLDVSGAGWTPDAYAGYWIEITSGSQVGQTHTIQENTADRIIVSRAFSADTGLCTFNIVRPATELKAIAAYSLLFVSGFTGDGQVYVQDLYCNSAHGSYYASVGIAYSNSRYYLSRFIVDNVATPSFNAAKVQDVTFNNHWVNPDTFATVTTGKAGFSFVRGYCTISNVNQFYCSNAFLCDVRLSDVTLGYPSSASAIYRGSRFKQCQCVGVKSGAVSGDNISNTAGYSPVKFSGSGGTGLLLQGSSVTVGPGVVVENNASHGIEVRDQSTLVLNGAVVGTGNAGAGVYAHTHSAVRTKAGSPPTLTGTIGDCSTDGTTQATTWADVEAGSPVSDLNEMTTIEAE